MIWALLWCAYLAVGCGIAWAEMPEGVAEIMRAEPDVSPWAIWLVAIILVLTWPVWPPCPAGNPAARARWRNGFRPR